MKSPVIPPGGLNPAANPFSSDARGPLKSADNCVIPSVDKLEPRRGADLSPEATSSAPTTIGEFYNDTLFVQHGTKVSRDVSSSFTELGSYSPPSGASMKFLGGQGKEVNGDFYFTTSAGVYTIDSTTATPKLSGIQRPGDFWIGDPDAGLFTRLTGNVNAGWMPTNAAVAARAVLGRKDANNNIKLSAPSGRIVVVNPADITVTAGGIVLTSNVVTATVTSHNFRIGDLLSLSSSDGGVFTTANNVVTSITATTIVWAQTHANHTSGVDITITSGTKNVQWAVNLTDEAVAGDFVQLYRTSDVAGASNDPGDECFLAYERTLTSTDISNSYVVITDTTPSAFLQDPLYTNASSGDPTAENSRPPLAKGLCLFDGRAFYINTTGRHRLNLRLLGTGSPSGLQVGDVVAVNTRALIMTAEGSASVDVFTSFSASRNIAKTVTNIALALGRNVVGCDAFATHDGDNGTGGILVEEVALASTFADGSSGNINAIYAATSRASAWADNLAATKAITAASTSRTSNVVTVRCSSHGFAQGAVVMIAYDTSGSPDSNFHVGLKTVASVVDANNFTYAESGSNATLSGGTAYYAYATTYKSDNNPLPIVYSKQGQPDAVPLLNFINDIPRGVTVLAAAPLRGALYAFLQNGDIWTVSGSYPYRVQKFDGTATLLAEASLVEHSNRLLCLTTQGVVAVSENGVEILDDDIRPELKPLIQAEIGAGTLGSIRACSYESEHQYRLYLSTTNSYVVYVYNSLYRKWTKQSTGRAWGVVRRSTDKLIEGHTTLGRFWAERKALDRSDIAEYMGLVEIGPGSGNTGTGALTAFAGQIAVGDVMFDNVVGNGFTFAWTVTAVTGSVGNQSVTATINAGLDAAGSAFGDFCAGGGVDVYVYRPYTSTVLWLPDSAGSPHAEKNIRDVQLHFQRYSVYAGTMTTTAIDGSSTPTDIGITMDAPSVYSYSTVPTLPISKRMDVDDAVKTTPQLAVGFNCAEPFPVWTLLGYTIEFEDGSERVGT